jgi:arylsulfatase A-like enzyme
VGAGHPDRTLQPRWPTLERESARAGPRQRSPPLSRAASSTHERRASGWASAAGWGAIGGLAAGSLAGYLECLFLLFHIGDFAVTAGLVQRAVGIYALGGGASGAVIGSFARWIRPAARETRDALAVAFSAVLAGFLAAFSLAYLLGISFALRKLSPPALAGSAATVILSLLAFLILSRLSAGALRAAESSRGKRLRWSLALTATAVLLGLLAAPTLVTIQGSGREPGAGTGPRLAQPNVLVIVLDAARPDFFSCYGDSRKHTPNLDALAAEGQLYLHAHSSSNWSIPGHTSLFSGLYPTSHGALKVASRVGEKVPLLADILAGNGWATASFYENPLVGRVTGLDRGFSVAVGPELDHRTKLTFDWILERLLGRRSRTTQCLRLAGEWIEDAASNRRPYFVFLNLMPTHFPYEARQPYFNAIVREKGLRSEDCRSIGDLGHWATDQRKVWQRLAQATPGELACVTALYESNIRYLDDNLGQFLGRLRSNGQLQNTVVVVTSDHGENLGEHGLFTHMRNALFEQATHIPLIVWAPGRVPPARLENPVSLVDVMPTILELVGLGKKMPPGTQGMDVRRSAPDRIVLAEYWDEEKGTYSRAAIAGSRKIIAGSDGTLALFDLESDPGESTNLATREPDETTRLHALLVRFVAGLQPPFPKGSETRGRDELLRTLRSLGYIQ